MYIGLSIHIPVAGLDPTPQALIPCPPMITDDLEARRRLLIQIATEAKKKKNAWRQTADGKSSMALTEIRVLYRFPGIYGKDLPNDGPEPIPQTFPKRKLTREYRMMELAGELPEQVALRKRAERLADVYSRPLLTIHQLLGPWSVKHVAEGTGITRVIVSKTLRGMKKLTVDVLLRLSLFLDIDPVAVAAFCHFQRIAYLKWGARRMTKPHLNRKLK
jgi:transcriptional regulator with XRE-family HTH domain